MPLIPAIQRKGDSGWKLLNKNFPIIFKLLTYSQCSKRDLGKNKNNYLTFVMLFGHRKLQPWNRRKHCTNLKQVPVIKTTQNFTFLSETHKHRNQKLPEIDGVRTPSPITMQVPIKARTSKNLCNTLCLSKVDFNLVPKLDCSDEPVFSFLKSESSSSANWQLGNELTLAWRHSNEYKANVPPSPLSSALSTINTYLRSGTRVRVQNTKDKTPKISSLVSECSISSANVLLYTYKGEVLKSP